MQLEAIVAFQLQFMAERVFLAITGLRAEHHFVYLKRFFAGDG